MKKMTLVLLAALLPSASVFAGGGYYQKSVDDCSKSSLYRELDGATIAARAVTTVIKCDRDVELKRPAPKRSACKMRAVKPACGCGQAFEKVVDREYYVRETRAIYQPVVTYIPVGAYTTIRKILINQ
ncbi:MAG: hypothetical protein LBJ73_03705 [Rickettsiales bacterium]|jgi:hypothetical protein|nr:hypothetical protein [Rickettsiales bacterium]